MRFPYRYGQNRNGGLVHNLLRVITQENIQGFTLLFHDADHIGIDRAGVNYRKIGQVVSDKGFMVMFDLFCIQVAYRLPCISIQSLLNPAAF